uniref:CNNM transmembrane domain-containing protein n=1 Tax=Cucumis melo TaxID=3656 RepID=A0A9I9CQB4_CUCME
MAANDVPCCEPRFWMYLLICVGLVAFAGLMSGLTLGLMSLSLVDLEVLATSGRPDDQKNAAKILPIVKNQHLLLCTLLISNAMAMEALPIFIDALLPAWGAIVISVTLILTFGEIIPQAICSRYGLSVGAKLSVVVRVLLLVLFPLSYPISKLLDWLLGKGHFALLRRAELKTFVDMHGNKAGKGGELTQEETAIITGALDMTLKTARDAMTPLTKLFSLDINSKLNEYASNLTLILVSVKNLIKFNPEEETPIRNLTIRKVPRVRENLPLYDILNQFQQGHSHMAVVIKSHNETKEPADSNKLELETATPVTEMELGHIKLQIRNICSNGCSDTDGKSTPDFDEDVIGIITLEDVMEELLQEEILDETDEYVAVHNKLKVNMKVRRSTSESPGGPHLQWISPVASPLSSYHHSPLSSSYNHSPILHSPIPPHIHSPFNPPSLSSSPRNYFHSSPTPCSVPSLSASPSSHKISRKSYEKLKN